MAAPPPGKLAPPGEILDPPLLRYPVASVSRYSMNTTQFLTGNILLVLISVLVSVNVPLIIHVYIRVPNVLNCWLSFALSIKTCSLYLLLIALMRGFSYWFLHFPCRVSLLLVVLSYWLHWLYLT